MEQKLHWDILDSKRVELLPRFDWLSGQGFYLAGGTGLALQYGHRDSIDFDFFTYDQIDTLQLFSDIQENFIGTTILKTYEEKNTLYVVINDIIKLSFITYSYDLVMPVIHTEYFDIASDIDIACMKLSAITSRSLEKDYVDLYYILHRYTLSDIIQYAQKKYANIDKMVYLKSLVYFDDVIPEHILYKQGYEISTQTVRDFLVKTVTDFG